MITMAPLPDWKHLFQCIFERKYNNDYLSKPWQKKGNISGWLSRSAWSLALISKWRKETYNKSNCIVWVPDYFCNAALTPLRVSGVTLIFYPITEKMVPDNHKCKKLAQKTPPDIFLFVHYFGKPSNSKTIYDFCKSHKTWLIEDAAHILKPVKGVGIMGDFVIYSPYKHLPLPDGALLIACKSGPSNFGDKIISITGLPKSWVYQLKEIEIKAANYLRSSSKESIVWLIKRILQKFRIKRLNKFSIKFSESPDSVELLTNIIGPSQSRISRKLLPIFIKELNSIAIECRKNQLYLDKLLYSDKRVLIAKRPLNQEWSPYLSAYTIELQDPENVYGYFKGKLGLPVLTWPDLAPEVVNNKSSYINAWALRHKRIYISIHQSIQHSDLKKKINIF